jgi:hypothetical protein
MFYLFMSFTQAEEVQKNGVVFVVYMVGSMSSMHLNRSFMNQFPKMFGATALRVAGVHRCYSDYRLSPFLNLAAFLDNTFTQTRTRTHKGKERNKLTLRVHIPYMIHAIANYPALWFR